MTTERFPWPISVLTGSSIEPVTNRHLKALESLGEGVIVPWARFSLGVIASPLIPVDGASDLFLFVGIRVHIGAVPPEGPRGGPRRNLGAPRRREIADRANRLPVDHREVFGIKSARKDAKVAVPRA